jgi:hypothetical protein
MQQPLKKCDAATSSARWRLRLMGFGFIWMAVWAMAGSLLGMRIQREILAGQESWLNSVQRDLLRSAHAHMNSLSILCIVTGLCVPVLARTVPPRVLKFTLPALPLSVIAFGVGLTLEAMTPPSKGSISVGAFITGTGGSVLIAVLMVFGAAAWSGRYRT